MDRLIKFSCPIGIVLVLLLKLSNWIAVLKQYCSILYGRAQASIGVHKWTLLEPFYKFKDI